jgi:glutathione S-transferase
MVRLHDFILSPFGRKLRLVLAEKRREFTFVPMRPWDQALPIDEMTRLQLIDGTVLDDAAAAAEYIEETTPHPALWPADPLARARARRWSNWLDRTFWCSVTAVVLEERVLGRYRSEGSAAPDQAALKAALGTSRICLARIEPQLASHGMLVGGLTVADLTLAAHLSSMDYFGDVPWQALPATREWYAMIKSRPSFRPLLQEALPGFAPVSHYADLDF